MIPPRVWRSLWSPAVSHRFEQPTGRLNARDCIAPAEQKKRHAPYSEPLRSVSVRKDHVSVLVAKHDRPSFAEVDAHRGDQSRERLGIVDRHAVCEVAVLN